MRLLPQLQTSYARTAQRGPVALVAILSLAVALAGEVGEPHHVTAVRFWSLGEVTRIAIETDGDFHVHSDRLENPDRIFFDLTGTIPNLGSKAMTVIPVSDRFVRQIRVAEPQHGVTRVVLDLAGVADASLSRLDNPSRLIIELRDRKGSESGRATEANAAAPVQPASRKPEHRTFVPPPAAPVTVIYSKRASDVLPEPPRMYLLVAGLKLNAGVLGASVPVLLTKAPAPAATNPVATPAPIVTAKLPASLPENLAAAQPSLTATPGTAPATVKVAASLAPSASETALPAKRNTSGDQSMIRVLGLKVGRIVLDPGHGGQDTGTIGSEGLREKDLVLDVAKRLGAMIEERMGSEVIFTRSDDTFIPLERRTEIANEAKADLFLSIHANSSSLRTAAGVETYYLNFTTSHSALEVAARENSGSQQTVYDLQDLVEKIALKDKVEESREFATRIQSSLFTLSAKTNVHAKDRGVRKAPFVVLIGASMPSVLAEIGFISNPHDESTMKRTEYREKMAEALYKGLASYASTLSHFQVAQTR